MKSCLETHVLVPTDLHALQPCKDDGEAADDEEENRISWDKVARGSASPFCPFHYLMKDCN